MQGSADLSHPPGSVVFVGTTTTPEGATMTIPAITPVAPRVAIPTLIRADRTPADGDLDQGGDDSIGIGVSVRYTFTGVTPSPDPALAPYMSCTASWWVAGRWIAPGDSVTAEPGDSVTADTLDSATAANAAWQATSDSMYSIWVYGRETLGDDWYQDWDDSHPCPVAFRWGQAVQTGWHSDPADVSERPEDVSDETVDYGEGSTCSYSTVKVAETAMREAAALVTPGMFVVGEYLDVACEGEWRH